MKERREKGTGTLIWEGTAKPAYGLVTVNKRRKRVRLGKGLSKAKAAATLEAVLEQIETGTWTPPPPRRTRPGGAASVAMTVRELAAAWASGDLLKKHGKVYGLKDKKSAGQDSSRLGRCYEIATRGRSLVFGDLPVAEV